MFHRILWIFQVALIIFFIFLSSSKSVYALNNTIRTSQDLYTNIELFNNTGKVERPILDYRKNGVRLVIRIVSGVNNLSGEEEDDRFPIPPIRDLSYCVINVSTVCVENKIAQYIDAVGRLDEIILLGNAVKFVKVRKVLNRLSSHQAMDSLGEIDRSINDFFDEFALRITLPGWNKQNEQNQIDFMFDDSDSVEGRGKGGGGGGGNGGANCKQMMMCMMMALKMNMLGMMGLMMLKGVMMTGMFLMMTKSMLLMKFMEPKNSGNSGATIKKIVVLTKGYSGLSHDPSPHSNYGGPPSSPSGKEHYGGNW